MQNSRNVESVLDSAASPRAISILLNLLIRSIDIVLIVDHNWLDSSQRIRCIREADTESGESIRETEAWSKQINRQLQSRHCCFFAPSRISPRDHQLHGPGNINVQHRLFMILNWNYNLLWHVSERINFSGTGKVVRVWCAFHSGFFLLSRSGIHDGWCWCCPLFSLFFSAFEFIDSHSHSAPFGFYLVHFDYIAWTDKNRELEVSAD